MVESVLEQDSSTIVKISNFSPDFGDTVLADRPFLGSCF